MKTKINFSIDSKEITKQLTDVLTAEAVKQARDITQKKFAAELTRKTDEIIKSFDNELQKDSYTYRNGGVFKKTLYDAVKTAIAETYKNNMGAINEMVKKQVDAAIYELKDAVYDYMNAIDKKVKDLVGQEVKGYIGDAIIKAVFERNGTEAK